jgi:hypothetical protein
MGGVAFACSVHARSSSRVREAACRRMNDSTPMDGLKKKLRRDSAQRCGKCSSARESLDEVPRKAPLCRVSSVRECCAGARITREQKVSQILHQEL